MTTQTIETKKNPEQNLFDKAYNLAIDHAIETVRKSLREDLAEMIIVKLEKLKSLET